MEGIFALIIKNGGGNVRYANGKPILFTSESDARKYVESNQYFKGLAPVELNEKEMYILENTGYLPRTLTRN